MRILPVIDLLGGKVVRAIGGRRSAYRPVISQIAKDAWPSTVAAAYRERGFAETYVADLDAIAGHVPAWSQYAAIAGTGLQLWLDAGLASLDRAQQLLEFRIDGQPLHRLIVGLETLDSINLLEELVAAIGSERLVFSLDLQHGLPRTAIPAWRSRLPLEIAADVLHRGIRRLLLLDVADVGESRGSGTLPLCRQIRALDATVELIAGGGIRHQADVNSLASAGCNAVLVASALHDGRL